MVKIAMNTLNILVVSNEPQTTWLQTAIPTLESLAYVEVVPLSQALLKPDLIDYNVILVDSVMADADIIATVQFLHQQEPRVPVVVVTVSPTWKRAREVFLAGGADYIRKSASGDALRSQILDIVTRFQQTGYQHD